MFFSRMSKAFSISNVIKIAIDISQIVYGTGVSVYTKSLVRQLLKIDKENEYLLFGGSFRRKADIKDELPNARVFPIPPTLADLIWNKLHIFPAEKLLGKIDVLHTSDWAEIPSSSFKVTTIHDLYPIKFPKMVHSKILDVHRRKLYWAKKESKRIIVPSISTMKDLLNMGFDENIIRVIPEAPQFTKAGEEEIVTAKKKYQIQGDYMLAIGATPLKNTEKIINAFHLASAGKELKLIIAGKPSNMKTPEERNIRFLGHVPTSDLSALLTGAKGLLYASLYEGYGIPILEGFACGVPVVTSNVGSMPEVAGDAAILVDPTDTNSISEGIAQVIRGAKAYVDKGSERIKEFSWENTAKMTLKVYEESKK